MKQEMEITIENCKRRNNSNIWNDCICGITEINLKKNRNYSHSPKCKENHKINSYDNRISQRRNRRAERRKNHQCIYCAIPVQPIIKYPQACDCCRDKYTPKKQVVVQGLK